MAVVKSFPAATRRICLRMFSDGEVPIKDIAERFGVKRATIMSWAQALAIKKGSKITDEDLKARMSARGDHMRKFADDAEISPKQKKVKKARIDARYGPSPEEIAARKVKKEKSAPLSLFKDGLKIEDYKDMVEQHLKVMASDMERATSVDSQIVALSDHILLQAMWEAKDVLPPITSWADFERVNNMLRKNHNMDEKKGNASEGADLRILNAKVDKRKVIEAVVTKSA